MYIVIEMQNGVIGENVWNFANRAEAESMYYNTLSYAAVSEVQTHTVMLISDEGFVIECKCYKR